MSAGRRETRAGGQRGKRDARRDEILRACAGLMREGGVINTRLQDIADRLGIAYTALYYYFRNRDQLVSEVLLRTVELRCANLRRAEGDSCLDRLVDFVRREITEDPGLKIPPPPIYTLSAAHRARVLAARAAFIDELAALVASGRREGSMRDCHAQTVALCVQAIVELFYVLDDQITDRARTTVPRELADQVGRVLRNGIFVNRESEMRPSYRLPDADLLLGTRRGVDEGNDWLDDLLRVATGAFNAEGVGASIPRMAQSLGVSKTMFYRHFADKQDLLFLCYLRGIEVVEASNRIADLVGRDVLDSALIHRHNLYQFHASPRGPFTSLNAIDFLKVEQQRFVRHRNHGMRRTSERRWMSLQDAGSLHPWVDPVIVQTMLGRMLYWHAVGEGVSADATSLEHQHLLYRGLAPL